MAELAWFSRSCHEESGYSRADLSSSQAFRSSSELLNPSSFRSSLLRRRKLSGAAAAVQEIQEIQRSRWKTPPLFTETSARHQRREASVLAGLTPL